MRTFTPFQIWLETQVANGRTLTSVARALDMPNAQLTRLRQGKQSFPRPRLETGAAVTGLSISELLTKASPAEPEPILDPFAPPPEPAPPPPVVMFEVTPERVHVALQHGLLFGRERDAFCESRPQGDIDESWRQWCARREGEQPPPEPVQAPPEPPAPMLYDHLRRDAQRPVHGGNPRVITGGDDHSNYSIVVGTPDSE